ncbi:MAG TPA: Uma2 family endonuclease [Thermoanaerobaculia bacterium]|nr:Uma2 family endonuclease [Thermoanaerobaculia bacterium]
MSVAAIDFHRWTRQEYERLAEAGFFPPDSRVELVEGIVYDMAAQGVGHTTSTHLAAETLRPAFRDCYLRIQSPLALGPRSEPEPDIAIVPGKPRDYSTCHPTTALLVVEVADHSLLHDRRHKLPVYAAAGIPEAWILNLKRKVLEVYREPGKKGYTSTALLRAGDSVSPLARPGVAIAVADLLP